MKKTKLLAGLIVAGAMMVMFACKKEPGPGGKAHIHGHVEHDEVKIPDAKVEIWYDATSKPSESADNSTMCDAMGEFEFENLHKGDYYCWATGTVTDSTGTKTVSGGAAVKIDKKTGEFEADIHAE